MGMWDRALDRLRDWRDRAPDVIAGFDGVLALWEGRLDEARAEGTVTYPDIPMSRSRSSTFPMSSHRVSRHSNIELEALQNTEPPTPS
jgi:hypothetical protein